MAAMADEDFSCFYAATYRQVVAQIFALTGVFAEAEEVAQEAFARALRQWPKIESYDVPEAWVRRVAVNLARDRARRGRRAVAALLRLGPPQAVPPISVEDIALMDALRAIPMQYREVIVLHYVHGLSVTEIAVETEIPVGTVKTRLARGRRRLAVLLDDGTGERELPGLAGAGRART